MIRYIFKTLWRHRTRSIVTVSGAAVAMFVFCMVASVQEGMNRLTHGNDAQNSLIVFQENRFCPATSKLPEDYARQIRDVDGVKDVVPIQVWTNNCRASLDIIVFNGAEPKQIRSTRPVTLESGSWEDFESIRDAAIVGRSVAKRRGIKTGDQFSIGPISVKVAGVFESTIPAEENLIYTSLQFLQFTNGLDASGTVTQHEVLLNDGADPDRIASEIDQQLSSGPVATRTRRKGAFQTSTLSDLVDLVGFAHWLGLACVGLTLSLVATTTIMSVQDRIKEYAVLQTIGASPWMTIRIVLGESVLLSLAGGAIGTAIAILALAFGGFAIGAEGVTIAFQPSTRLALTGLAISLVGGLLAGVVPAIQASRVEIVNALRQA